MSSQGLELELSTSAIVAISASPLNPTSITHDEHTGVTKMLNDNAHLIPGAEQRHDGWHRKRHTGKYLTTDLEKLGLSKLAVENIVNKVVMLLNSDFYLHRGQPQEFAAALQKIPTYFTEEEETRRDYQVLEQLPPVNYSLSTTPCQQPETLRLRHEHIFPRRPSRAPPACREIEVPPHVQGTHILAQPHLELCQTERVHRPQS